MWKGSVGFCSIIIRYDTLFSAPGGLMIRALDSGSSAPRAQALAGVVHFVLGRDSLLS